MTHHELVDRAMRWLKTTRGCGVVFREHTADSEHPDALGFRTAMSILVECKVSRSDFWADQQKASRVRMQEDQTDRPAHECWYLTPPRLLRPTEIPAGWGLLEAGPRRVQVIVEGRRPVDDRSVWAMRNEIYRLYCEVRRYQAQGITYRTIQQQQEERHARHRQDGQSGQRLGLDQTG